MLELRDLECFLAIADEGNFSRAAAILKISQPSLSRRIASLERELGVPLFSRARRQIALTPAGRALAREARAVFAETRTVIDVVRAAARGVSGHLRIGYRSAFRYRILPQALRMMRERHPDVALTVSGGASSDMLDEVRARTIDVALVTSPDGPDDLAVAVLKEVPVVVALPAGHRLARRRIVQLEDLAGEPFVDIGESDVPAYRSAMRSLCARAGFTPRIVAQVESADLLAACVAAGIGVGLVFDLRDIPLEGLVYREFRPAGPTIRFMAVHRQGNDNPILPAFLELVRISARRG